MIDIVKISKALGDSIRYKILLMLVNHEGCTSSRCQSDIGGVCNCEIMEEFGMIQSRVSYHMKELTGSGLVIEVSRGKWKYYFINTEILQAYIQQMGVDFKL